MNKPQKLLKKIVSSFEDAPPPVAKHYTWGGSEQWEEASKFWGKTWSQLTEQLFDENNLCFSSFPPEDFGYFFGALMHKALENGRFENNAFDLLFVLWDPESDPATASLRDNLAHNLRKFLSDQQVSIIEEFIEFRSQFIDKEESEMARSFVRSLKN